MTRIAFTAGGFLFRDGLVLLGLRSARRSSYPGLWDAIGGHAEPGESPRDALIRELQEEILVTPTEFVELAVLSDARSADSREAHHMFLVTSWKGVGPVAHNDEHSELRWFHPSEALGLSLAHPGYVTLLSRLF